MLSAASYLAAMILLYGAYRRYGRRPFLAAAAFNGWLMLEEINYGQILFNRSKTNYYYDEEQLSLHTALLRPVKFGMPFDLAGVADFCVAMIVTVAVPIVLKRHYKMKGHPAVFALPFALWAVVCIGHGFGVMVPTACGYDSFEEITETIQAAGMVYFTVLLLGHLNPNARREGPA